MLTQYRKLGIEQARIAGNNLFFRENSLKVVNGERDVLTNVYGASELLAEIPVW